MKNMEKESKLLEKQYLETRLREFKEIKRKEIVFDFEESDRSKSLYIKFFSPTLSGGLFKNHTLRISDHYLSKCPHTQFVISPDDILSKKKKAQFMKTVELCIRKTLDREFYRRMEKVSKEVEKNK